MSTSSTRRFARALGGRLALLAAVTATAVTFGPAPAQACGCGAFVGNELLTATQETALVQLTGGQETVTMNIVTDTAATDAAFVMPVPSRATFDLGDPAIFGELDSASRPKVEYVEVEVDGDGSGAAPGAGAGDVVVTDRVTLGPYDVAQLTGTDAAAVGDWLQANGFQLSPELADGLTPYLADGWSVVAVRLTPEDDTGFDAGLPPMRVSFATDTPVYPMRLSALASNQQNLRLYVLADHRMDISNPTPNRAEASLTFAGWMEPADLDGSPNLIEAITSSGQDRLFLTRYDDTMDPEDITADIALAQAPTDETYRATVTETRYVNRGDSMAGWATVAAIALPPILIFGLLAWYFVWRARRRYPPTARP